MSVHISVEGMDDLERALKKLPESAREFVRDEMYYLACEAVEIARTLAPVRTGYLRATIRWIQESVSGGKEGYWLVATAPYARYQEFGTRHIKPRLFMTAAWYYVMQESRRVVREALERILAESSRR